MSHKTVDFELLAVVPGDQQGVSVQNRAELPKVDLTTLDLLRRNKASCWSLTIVFATSHLQLCVPQPLGGFNVA